MKKPDGTIDIIGSAMALGSGIVSLINEFAPDKAERKINVAIRRLKHRFKNVPIETYVNVNFNELSQGDRDNLILEFKALLNRN